jgi:hypothetical protein
MFFFGFRRHLRALNPDRRRAGFAQSVVDQGAYFINRSPTDVRFAPTSGAKADMP